jgi:hypothetical protein
MRAAYGPPIRCAAIAPSYRERLRVEGLALAACGALASVALVAFVPESRRRPASTALQLGAVVLLLETFGKRAVRGWMAEASELRPGEEGSGEPTPLWMLPPIVLGLAATFVLLPETGLPAADLAGWDAGLRVTGGCVIVGLAQALAFHRVVAAGEAATGRRYLRVKGSHLWCGTKLGYAPG